MNGFIPKINSASEDLAGTVELASVSETIEGTNATKAVTPKGVTIVINRFSEGIAL